jgi:pimeloyl-ACP methyl ester carboxylesterase
VIGEALWQLKPDFATREGLSVAFAPGFDVPDAFVDDVNRMTYTAYDESASDDFASEEPLAQRMRDTGLPLMVLMGAEEQIVDDPVAALSEYAKAVPRAQTHLVAGAGHSPNVEKPALTAKLVLRFANSPSKGLGSTGGAPDRHAGHGETPERTPADHASGVRSATGGQ